jgi:hypothetical protein
MKVPINGDKALQGRAVPGNSQPFSSGEQVTGTPRFQSSSSRRARLFIDSTFHFLFANHPGVRDDKVVWGLVEFCSL